MANITYQAVDEEDRVRAGLEPTPQPWEDGQRTDGGPGSVDSWYFDARFDDGSTAVILLMTKPLLRSRDPLTPGVQITITAPDGTKHSQTAFFPPEAFRAARGACDMTIGENCVQGDLHRYQVRVQAGNLAADLAFTASVPAWRPGTGKTHFSADGAAFFGFLAAVPHGTVEGCLTYNGGTHAVHGAGYHDHKFGTVDLNQVMWNWVWGHAHVGGYTVVFAEMASFNKFGNVMLPFFLLARGDEILTGDGRPLTLQSGQTQMHSSGHPYENRLNFSWQQDSNRVVLRLSQPRIIEATNPLAFIPPEKRDMERSVGHPFFFRFNSDLDLEVSLQGIEESIAGKALYELMLVR